MLSDSKIREVGFIRNSSSRKIIYNPDFQHKNQSSDNSFSSFEYENHSKVSLGSSQKLSNEYSSLKDQNKNNQQKLQINDKSSLSKNKSKPLTLQIPKPSKKHFTQPQFQNERLKKNFFQESKRSSLQQKQKVKNVLSKTNTPNFNESKFKQDLEEINNICNRIGNMRLEGNFSFNPKTNNKLIKGKGLEQKLQLQSDQNSQQKSYKQINTHPNHYNLVQDTKINQLIQSKPQLILNKPKHNNYFSTANYQRNRFQYDFQSSSCDDQRQDSSNSDFQQNQHHNRDLMRYQEQQKRQNINPQSKKMTDFKILSNNPVKNSKDQKYSQKYSHLDRNSYQQSNNPSYQQKKSQLYPVSKQVQNEKLSYQNEEQLIKEYNKDDFGIKIPIHMRAKNQQLAQNKALQNMVLSEAQQGIIATNGGVCFNVDVKQFSKNSSIVNDPPLRRATQNSKKKKANDKEQLLKRRQMAKIYSKQARFRLFGFA